MMTYEIAKRNYDAGLWTATQVALAVKAGILAEELYEQITGQPYSNPLPLNVNAAQNENAGADADS